MHQHTEVHQQKDKERFEKKKNLGVIFATKKKRPVFFPHFQQIVDFGAVTISQTVRCQTDSDTDWQIELELLAL